METFLKMRWAKDERFRFTPQEFTECMDLTEKLDYDTTWFGHFENLSSYSACILAKDGDKVIGYLLFANGSHFSPTTFFVNEGRYGVSPEFSVEQIVVDESCREQGIATKMFKDLLGMNYMKQNCRELDAEICPHNTESLKWHEKMGFRINVFGARAGFLNAHFNARKYYKDMQETQVQQDFDSFASAVSEFATSEIVK